MKVSNCCGVHGFIEKYDGRLSGTNYYDAEEAGICPKCKEHCEYVEEKQKKEKMIPDSYWDGYIDAAGNCFSDADPGL